MKIPNDVINMMNQYKALFNHYFEDELIGIYLHGSLVLDDYKPGVSDIDFITVTKSSFTVKDLEKVSQIHSKFTDRFKNTLLDGVYITQDEIGKMYNHAEDKNLYYNEGEVAFDRYFNFNPVTWHLFKNNGINIYGPDTSKFAVEVTEVELRHYVLKNMKMYWTNRVNKLAQAHGWKAVPEGLVDEEVEWTVLGLLRQFYTLKENSIVSKSGAGNYGLNQLDNMWHSIIKEALNIRNNIPQSITKTSEERINELIDFSNNLIKVSTSMSDNA